jgi:hypothetical protein
MTFGYAVDQDQPAKGVTSKSFTVTKGGMLEADVRVGDFRISTWDKNEVSIKVTGLDKEDLEDLEMTQTGNTVHIEFGGRGGDWGDWHRNVHYAISLPSQFDLDIRTSGGDIEITDKISGKIKGKTSGGNIKLSDVTGTVDMNTSGGDIRTGNIQGDAELHTSGGNIEIGKVNGEIVVNTSGGDIRVESVGKSLRAKTSGGNIEIGDVGGDATVSTAGGDIKVGKVSGGASLSTAGGNVELRSASGTVTARTAGGDIHLENITGSIEAKTSGGEIEAELIPSGKGRSRLISSGGEVKLFIPENAKATIEASIRIQGRWRDRSEEYEIISDFKAEKNEKTSDEREIRARFVLNGGGDVITLETVNSNIVIRKLK